MNAYFFNLYSFGNYMRMACVIAYNEPDAYKKAEKRFPKMTANLFYTATGDYFIL